MTPAIRVIGAGAVSARGKSLAEARNRPADDCAFAGPAGARAAYPAPFDPRRDLPGIAEARRLGRQTAMALAAALDATAASAPLPEETALVLGTAHGAVAETVAFLDSARGESARYASPTAFSGSLHASMAAPIGRALGMRGPMLVVCDGNRSFETALMTAIQMLRAEEAPLVLVGACDAYHPMTRDTLAEFGAISTSSQAIDHRMLRTERGVHLGEGAGFLLLACEMPESTGTTELMDASGVRVAQIGGDMAPPSDFAPVQRILALADGTTRSARLHAAAIRARDGVRIDATQIEYPAALFGAFGSLSAVVCADEAHRRLHGGGDGGGDGDAATLVLGVAAANVTSTVFSGHGTPAAGTIE